MLKRVFTALLSTLCFGLLMACLAYNVERQPDTYYMPFWANMMIYCLYSAPVYFIVGIPASYFMDKLVSRAYWARLIAYSVAGASAGFLYIMVMALSSDKTNLISTELTQFMILGALASLLYFHLALAVDKLHSKK